MKISKHLLIATLALATSVACTKSRDNTTPDPYKARMYSAKQLLTEDFTKDTGIVIQVCPGLSEENEKRGLDALAQIDWAQLKSKWSSNIKSKGIEYISICDLFQDSNGFDLSIDAKSNPITIKNFLETQGDDPKNNLDVGMQEETNSELAPITPPPALAAEEPKAATEPVIITVTPTEPTLQESTADAYINKLKSLTPPTDRLETERKIREHIASVKQKSGRRVYCLGKYDCDMDDKLLVLVQALDSLDWNKYANKSFTKIHILTEYETFRDDSYSDVYAITDFSTVSLFELWDSEKNSISFPRTTVASLDELFSRQPDRDSPRIAEYHRLEQSIEGAKNRLEIALGRKITCPIREYDTLGCEKTLLGLEGLVGTAKDIFANKKFAYVNLHDRYLYITKKESQISQDGTVMNIASDKSPQEILDILNAQPNLEQ